MLHLNKLNSSLIFLLLLSACTSKPKVEDKPTAPDMIKAISLEEVRQALDMEENAMGFTEKSFNSCALPKELRAEPACKTQHFAVIRFQVLCRDTEGTTELTVTQNNLRPKSADLEWVVGAFRGRTKTDSNGFGTALVLSDRSVSKRRFVIKFHQKALGLTAEEVSKIVVPDNWCT